MVLALASEAAKKEQQGWVHCLICTHTVEARVVAAGRRHFVKAGQKCPRCASSLDPAYVVRVDEAA
jgi:hypothetical protein